MKSIVRIELFRAFKSRGFFLSVILGCIIAVLHCAMIVFPLEMNLEKYIAHDFPMMYPGWLFSSWMGGNINTMYSFLYFLIIPVLAALPFADSFFLDVKGGFIQNICIRLNKKHYYIAKYISVFLSGGTAVLVPLLLNFSLSCLLLPAMKPEVASFNTLIGENSTFPDLYFSHPFFYVFIYLVIIFIFSGLFSTMSLVVSYYLNHRFLVVITPFIAYLFLLSLFNLLGLESWEPTNFLHPAYSHYSLIAMIIEASLLLMISIIGFILKGVKEDICN